MQVKEAQSVLEHFLEEVETLKANPEFGVLGVSLHFNRDSNVFESIDVVLKVLKAADTLIERSKA